MTPYINVHREIVYRRHNVVVNDYFSDILNPEQFKTYVSVLTYDEVKAGAVGYFDANRGLPNCKTLIDYTPRRHSPRIDCWYRDDDMVINLYTQYNRTSVGDATEFIQYVKDHFTTICKRVNENHETTHESSFI